MSKKNPQDAWAIGIIIGLIALVVLMHYFDTNSDPNTPKATEWDYNWDVASDGRRQGN